MPRSLLGGGKGDTTQLCRLRAQRERESERRLRNVCCIYARERDATEPMGGGFALPCFAEDVQNTTSVRFSITRWDNDNLSPRFESSPRAIRECAIFKWIE